MKAYTDIKQSKKLAEILPLESADMHYATWTILDSGFIVSPNQGSTIENLQEDYGNQIIPCWSLAALLSVLPKIVNTQTLFIETSAALWHIGYRDVYIARSENLVDACVDMIMKLHELNLL